MYKKMSIYAVAPTAREVYDDLAAILEVTHKDRDWAAEFNDLARELELARRDPDVCSESGLPWVAEVIDGDVWIYSPPIGFPGKMVRLGVNACDPMHGKHINARACHVDPKSGRPIPGRYSNYICLISNVPNLTSIFATWDYVAREGINRALEAGAIAPSWVDRVIDKAGACNVRMTPDILQAEIEFQLAEGDVNAAAMAARAHPEHLELLDVDPADKLAMWNDNPRMSILIARRDPESAKGLWAFYSPVVGELEYSRLWMRMYSPQLGKRVVNSRQECRIYPDRHERDLARDTRTRVNISDNDELSLAPLYWALGRFEEFSKDGRTANYKSRPSGATHYYACSSYVEHVNQSRRNGFSYSFEWERAIVRYEDGSYGYSDVRAKP